MLLFTPGAERPQRLTYPPQANEVSALLYQHTGASQILGNLIHRAGNNATFVAYANAEGDAAQWGGGSHLPPNLLAGGVLGQLGFVNVMRRPYYNGPIVLVGANDQALTSVQLTQVEKAWQRWKNMPLEYETHAKLTMSSCKRTKTLIF